MQSILKIQSCVVRTIVDFMHSKDVLQLMPVMLSPETDPLCHSVFEGSIEYYGQKLQLTKSMILHKQVALASGLSNVFLFPQALSPNVRLEKKELVETGRHLIEFSQLDIELEGATKRQFMDFMEELIVRIIKDVKRDCAKELAGLGRELSVPKQPFKVYESNWLREKYGDDFERKISEQEKEPFWIFDFTREFYDREDKDRKGYYHNYDLIFPEGFGEALSGGEREFEYDMIARKLQERKMEPERFATFLSFAKAEMLKPSAGGGLGIERTVRFLTGTKDIKEITLFPRIPGQKVLF